MNNSKQTVLSIVGIAILVIAVVGVSFAFFTYSKQGQTNNIITTGTIEFDSDVNTATALTLTNRFPQTDAEGKQNTNAGDGGTKYLFNVHGTIPTTAKDIYYGVFVKETTPSGKSGDTAHRFPASQISVYVTGEERSPAASSNDSVTVVPRFSTGNYRLTSNVSGTNGELVAYGTIDNNNKQQYHDFTLTMWVNNTVKISDTSGAAAGYQYRAHEYVDQDHATDQKPLWDEKPAGVDNDTRPVFSDMWYSVRVDVKANDDNPTLYSSQASPAS